MRMSDRLQSADTCVWIVCSRSPSGSPSPSTWPPIRWLRCTSKGVDNVQDKAFELATHRYRACEQDERSKRTRVLVISHARGHREKCLNASRASHESRDLSRTSRSQSEREGRTYVQELTNMDSETPNKAFAAVMRQPRGSTFSVEGSHRLDSPSPVA